MKAGPKTNVAASPLDLGHLDGLSEAERCIQFTEEFCVCPEGYGAGKPMRLRDWQREFLQGVYAPEVKIGALSVAKGNGKTGLLAAVCLYRLYGAGTWAPRVYATASSERQAGILFGACKSMVELSPALLEQTQVHTSKLLVPLSDGLLQPLPATSKSLQGYRPAFVCLDEAAEVDDSTFEALSLSLGKIPGSRMVCISTAPLDAGSFWHRLREAGRDGGDKSLFWLEFSAPEGADISDPATWRAANPAAGDFLDLDAIASDFKRVRPESFRRWRLNQCVETAGAFLPFGAFEKLGGAPPISAGSRVCLGFDGSIGSLNTGNADGTAIVAVSVDAEPTLELVALWEPPAGLRKDSGWSVPRAEVTAVLEACFEKWDVVEAAFDPHHYRSEIQAWAVRWPGRVIEWPSHVPQRMVPASDKFYSAVVEGKLRHTGDKRLEGHCRNATVKNTSAGPAIVKDYKMSRRKIDACIAAIIGVDRALFHVHQPVRRNRVFVGDYC